LPVNSEIKDIMPFAICCKQNALISDLMKFTDYQNNLVIKTSVKTLNTINVETENNLVDTAQLIVSTWSCHAHIF
jgi:hypothetical protein